MEFTGERLVPGKVPMDLYREHMTRYLFAKQFVQQDHHVLDLGCGAGYGSAELAANTGAYVVGVDISAEAVTYATEQYGGKHVRFEQMDCRSLEFEEATFDAVVSFEVIEHIEEVEAYLASVRQVLKEDGVFIVSTPNKKMYSDSMEDYENPYHVREYYYQEFVDLLHKQFPYVSIYLQDFMQGMRIQPYTDRSAKGVQKVDLDTSGVDASQASFFLAVCSSIPVEGQQEQIYTFAQSNILAEKDKHIQAVQQEVMKRDESVVALLHELKNKTEWIEKLQEEVRKRDESVAALVQELQTKTEWITGLQEEVRKRDESVRHLQAIMNKQHR
jgi:O-antigen biosynthesis protein